MNISLNNKSKIELDNSILIHPFYREENGEFYKNKLVDIKEVFYQVEIDTEDNNEFEAYKYETYYLLTFTNEAGDFHQYKSKVKPKNIDKVFYYIVKDEEITNIFPEKNKKELKKYITVKNDYIYDNSIFKLIEYNPFKTLIIGCGSILTLIHLSGCFDNLHPGDSLFLSFIIGVWLPLFLFFLLTLRYQRKIEKFKSKKEQEEKETAFEKFI